MSFPGVAQASERVKNTTAGNAEFAESILSIRLVRFSAISAVKHFFTGLSEEWRDLRGSGLGLHRTRPGTPD